MIDVHSLLIIGHLIGVAIGAGGAFMSDAMFFSSIKDERLTPTELRFLRLGSAMVWGGLAVLVLTGIGLFLFDPTGYLASTKFQVKMTVVAIIIANGLFFHWTHLPRMHRHADHHLPSSDEFVRTSALLMASGAVSVVSWISAIVLGSLGSVPFSYAGTMALYGAVVAVAIGVALVVRRAIIPHHRHTE